MAAKSTKENAVESLTLERNDLTGQVGKAGRHIQVSDLLYLSRPMWIRLMDVVCLKLWLGIRSL